MRINPRLILSGLVLLAAVFLSGQACQVTYRQDKRVELEGKTISLEVADNPSERTKGLGGRRCIPSMQGMLFEYSQPGYYPFWMKDMRFSIDIIWLDSDKKVVYIKPYISPDTYPQTFVSPQPAQYVLELKAGQAGRLNLTPGTKLSF